MKCIPTLARCGAALLALAVFATSALLPPEAARAHAAAPADPDPPPPEPPPPAPPCGGEGDPVTPFTGAWVHDKTDIVVHGVFSIQIVRKYDSQSVYDSPVGYGWSLNYDYRLFKYQDGTAVIRQHCGRRLEFTPSGGSFVSPGGTSAVLEEHPDGTHSLVYPAGTRYEFDLEGRLEAIQDSVGNRLEMSYDPRGKLPLTGTSPSAMDPSTPMIVAMNYRLTRVAERTEDGALTGRHVDLAYDETTGRLASATSYDGRTVTYQHDVHVASGLTTGNLVTVNGLEGLVTTYEYQDPEDPHNVTSFTSAGIQPITNLYQGDRVVQQDHGDTTLAFTYTVTPAPRTIVDRTVRDGTDSDLYVRQTVYDFDFDGFTLKTTDGLGNEFRYTRDPTTRLVTRFELWENRGTLAAPDLHLLKATDSSYDVDRNLTSRSVQLDSGETVTETREYQAKRVIAVQRSSTGGGAVLAHSFRDEYQYYSDQGNKKGRVQFRIRAAGTSSARTTSYVYTAGKPASVTLPDSHRIVRTYYPTDDPVVGRRGLLHEIHHEINGVPDPHQKVTYDYDAAGNTVSITDARGNETTREFDELGRVTKVINARDEETLITYAAPNGTDPGGLIRQVEVGRTADDGAGRIERLLYDADGRVTTYQRIDDADQFATLGSFVLDSDGNVLSATDADSRTTVYAYDVLGRRTSLTDAENRTYQRQYRADGLVASIVDPLLREYGYVYDDLGRLVQTEVTSGPVTSVTGSYAYDVDGRPIRVVDGNSNVTEYDYDALAQLTNVRLVGEEGQYFYDSRGRVDYILNGRGNKIDYSYEAWGAVNSVEFFDTESSGSPSRSISYGYDSFGNVTSIADTAINSALPGNVVYAATYDELNRMDQVTVGYVPGGARTLDYDYDRFGLTSKLTLQDVGQSLVHSYATNRLGRLTSASLPNGSGGQRTMTFGHLASGRVNQVTRSSGITTNLTYEQAGAIDTIDIAGAGGSLETYSYDYDDSGRISSFAVGAQSHGYSYDGLGRVVTASHPAGSGLPSVESFSYDTGGNRENPSDLSEYDYGANNRLVSAGAVAFGYDGDGSIATRSTGQSYTHDATNRLVSFGGGAVSASYVNDAAGRRIKKTVSGQNSYYLWAGGVVLAEYDGSGNRTADYGYVGGYSPAQVNYGASSFDVHHTAIGAPKLLTAASDGAISWKGSYTAYGSAVVDEDPDGNGSSVVFNPRLPGQYYDAESGLHDNLLRTYDPGTGRYLQEDPIGLAGGLNLYLYANGNPINQIDPTGTTPIYPPGWPPPGGGGSGSGEPPPPPPDPCDPGGPGGPGGPGEPGGPGGPGGGPPDGNPPEPIPPSGDPSAPGDASSGPGITFGIFGNATAAFGDTAVEISGFAGTDQNMEEVVTDAEFNFNLGAPGFRNENLGGFELDVDISAFVAAASPAELLDMGVLDVSLGPAQGKLFLRDGYIPVGIAIGIPYLSWGAGVSYQSGGGGTQIPTPNPPQ